MKTINKLFSSYLIWCHQYSIHTPFDFKDHFVHTPNKQYKTSANAAVFNINTSDAVLYHHSALVERKNNAKVRAPLSAQLTQHRMCKQAFMVIV